MKLLVVLLMLAALAGCYWVHECRPFIATKMDSRMDNRWEGQTICDQAICGLKCRW